MGVVKRNDRRRKEAANIVRIVIRLSTYKGKTIVPRVKKEIDFNTKLITIVNLILLNLIIPIIILYLLVS